MNRTYYKLSFILLFAFGLALSLASKQAYAQWPPFNFRLSPVFDDDRIIYTLTFANQTDTVMNNVTIKIPIPEGTQFVHADAQPTTQVNFDGTEVTFFTAAVYQPIQLASFEVEVTDPDLTAFTTQAWITWEGEPAGDYLTEEIVLDLNQQTLGCWKRPANARLQLEARATAAGDTITYEIYPRSISRLRMWDLKINVPLPAGTTFLSAEASPPFVATFDGREVSFFVLELVQEAEIAPLTFQVSTAGVTEPVVVTHAWASWKNAGPGVGRRQVLEEQTLTGDIIVQPHAMQQVVADMAGDVPLTNYDVRTIALQEDGDKLKVVFYTAGVIGPSGEPVDYTLYIDKDCSADTGLSRNGLGLDYQIRYRHDTGRAELRIRNQAEESWDSVGRTRLESLINGNMVTVWIPYELLENNRQFCWQGEARNRAEGFNPRLPVERVPNSQLVRLTPYQPLPNSSPAATTSLTATVTSAPMTPTADELAQAALAKLMQVDSCDLAALGEAAPPAPIAGKLAVPLDNGQALYNIHIFSLPDGQEILRIPNARQPNFRADGQRLLINREGSGVENLFEYNLADGVEIQVSDAPRDAHPFYDPWGNRVVYGNDELTVGSRVPARDENGKVIRDENNYVVVVDPRRPFIFVQCSLTPPHLESAPQCKDIPNLGVLVPAGQMGEIQGTHPVWTTNDMIAYKGCNSWAGFSACGIYSVPSASTKGFSNGFIPTQLTQDTSDIPTDTKGGLIAFTSQREGDWEAYIMTLTGTGVKNLSNSPTSNDGLPTISPDGGWVAFVSDRGGQWAVWAVPVSGGEAQKLFDLPTPTPWGGDDRNWLNERISWGP